MISCECIIRVSRKTKEFALGSLIFPVRYTRLPMLLWLIIRFYNMWNLSLIMAHINKARRLRTLI